MMKHPDILVLNKHFQPIHIITWKKCMTLLCKEHAHPLDREFMSYKFGDWINFSCSAQASDYPKINTVSRAIAIPEIIVLTAYNRLPDKEVKFSRQSVFARDDYTCQYCLEVLHKDDLTMDHILPRAKGGLTVWNNIVAACFPCNSRKADMTLREVAERYPQDGNRWSLKARPHKPKWLNPATSKKGRVHICKSWEHFMTKIDTEKV